MSERAAADPPLDNSPLGLRTSRTCCDRLSKYIVDPRRIVHKYSLLCLICLFIPGPYFADGILSTYKADVMEALDLTNKQFSMLFAFSSITGICCSPAYLIIASLGRTRVALAAGFVCAMGALGVTLGFQGKSFALMLVSRVFFWLALYMLMVVQTVLVYGLFHGRELVVAYGLVITACRFGGMLGFFLSGPLEEWCRGVLGSLFVAVALVFIAFIATVLFACLFRGTGTAQAVRPLLARGESRQASKVSLRLVFLVPRPVIATSISIGFLYGVVFPFEANADEMLQDVFGFDANNAGYLLTLAPAICLLSPLLGPLLGKSARGRLSFGIAGLLMVGLSMLLLSTEASWSPLPAFALAGIGYCIGGSALWTSIPPLVEATVPAESVAAVEALMTGMCYAAGALSQFVSNLAIGVILDSSTYRWMCIFLAVCSCLGALAGFAAKLWQPAAERALLADVSSRCNSSVQCAGDPCRQSVGVLSTDASLSSQPVSDSMVSGSSKEVLVEDDHFCCDANSLASKSPERIAEEDLPSDAR